MRIELNEPSMPKGTMFYINGLGAFENGKPRDLTAEEVEAFELEQGRPIKDAFDANPNIKLSAVKGGED